MRVVKVRKASGGSKSINNVESQTIEMSESIYEKDNYAHMTLDKAADMFSEDAEALFQCLKETLPGGTFDRLLGKMLAYKATHFVINHA